MSIQCLQPGILYLKSIQSARDNKLMHEEALASELAGTYFHSKQQHEKSLSLFLHSIQCYEKWGAHAVARRVESSIHNEFSPITILQHRPQLTPENLGWEIPKEDKQLRKRSL